MRIELLIHMDVLPDGTLAWWAESDQLPGFVAQEASLRDLIPVATGAARATAADRGVGVTEVALLLVEDPSDSQGEDVHYRLPEDQSQTPQTAGDARSLVREARELAAV